MSGCPHALEDICQALLVDALLGDEHLAWSCPEAVSRSSWLHVGTMYDCMPASSSICCAENMTSFFMPRVRKPHALLIAISHLSENSKLFLIHQLYCFFGHFLPGSLLSHVYQRYDDGSSHLRALRLNSSVRCVQSIMAVTAEKEGCYSL